MWNDSGNDGVGHENVSVLNDNDDGHNVGDDDDDDACLSVCLFACSLPQTATSR